jgi:hypothetical protein
MFWRILLLVVNIILIGCPVTTIAQSEGPIAVEVVGTDAGYQLYRAGEPYVIRGVGLEFGDIVSLAAHGGNSIRTWTTDNAAAVLDAAQANGVTVALTLTLQSERFGFDYDDAEAVAAQLDVVRKEVLKYRDHPALLAWIIGNELNFDYTNSKVYDAVNDISMMIHEFDPNHPTTTTVAGIGENVLNDLEVRAPDLDFLSFQVYGEIFNLANFVQDNQFYRPIWVTEWGTIGWWEMETTEWGAPIEMTSTEKAEVYLRAYEEVIRPLEGKAIGSFAFLWGQKQERTPTWFGMFIETGEETETVDVMHRLWTGEWPGNRSPVVRSLLLDGKTARQSVELTAAGIYPASFNVVDLDNDNIHYRWELKLESEAQQVGGDREARIESFESGLAEQNAPNVQFSAPTQPGAYRLFVYAYDGNNHAAHGNIPFLVTGN